MGRFYSVPIPSTAFTAAADFAELVVPSDAVMRLHEIKIAQSTEAGDAMSEQLRFAIKRATGSYASGSGGSAATFVKHSTGDAAAGITGEVVNTTQAGAGTGALTVIQRVAENVHNGWHYLPTPETRIDFSPGEALVVSLEAAPADSVTFEGYIVVEEIGG